MGNSELIRCNKRFKLRIQAKANVTGRSIPELLEFAEFPFIPPKKFKKENNNVK